MSSSCPVGLDMIPSRPPHDHRAFVSVFFILRFARQNLRAFLCDMTAVPRPMPSRAVTTRFCFQRTFFFLLKK